MMDVGGLFIYPVKGCRGISLTQAVVTPRGLAGDRQWMVVDKTGQFLTQRQYPQLARVTVQLMDDHLTLATTGMTALTLPRQLSGPRVAVTVWQDQAIAVDQGEEAAQWLVRGLGLPAGVRLVRQDPEVPRPVAESYRTQPTDQVSFADGFPVLVTNTASLENLNQRIIAQQRKPVTMDRFRPNVVIRSDQPFGEDTWPALHLGEVELALVKPCSRCIVTTTDQQTGDCPIQPHPAEPLATLSQFRQVPGQGILFGENAIPTRLGILNIGDPVEVIARP